MGFVSKKRDTDRKRNKSHPLFRSLALGLCPHPTPQNKTIFLQPGPLKVGNQTAELSCKVSGAGGTERLGTSWGRWAPEHTGAAACVSGCVVPGGQGAPRPGAGPSLRGLRCPASSDSSLLPVGEKKTQPLGAALSRCWEGQASCGAQARGRGVARVLPGDARSHLAGSKIAFFR